MQKLRPDMDVEGTIRKKETTANSIVETKRLIKNRGINVTTFIPKQYKKEPITVRLDFEKLEKVDKLATDFNLSRSEFINQCIDYAIEHTPMQKSDD